MGPNQFIVQLGCSAHHFGFLLTKSYRSKNQHSNFYLINSVDKPILLHRRGTTVSLATNPLVLSLLIVFSLTITDCDTWLCSEYCAGPGTCLQARPVLCAARSALCD